ncbi:MAG: hypothetical protein MI923_25920 [Phycisphaerales bacterium]|nr:hypothetical protein [Phycisphaerales bacterium]
MRNPQARNRRQGGGTRPAGGRRYPTVACSTTRSYASGPKGLTASAGRGPEGDDRAAEHFSTSSFTS